MSSGSSPETKYRICRFCRLNCRWTALQTRKYLAPISADKTLHCPVKYSEMRSSQEVLSRMDKKDSTASALILFSIEDASSRSSSSLNPDNISFNGNINTIHLSIPEAPIRRCQRHSPSRRLVVSTLNQPQNCPNNGSTSLYQSYSFKPAAIFYISSFSYSFLSKLKDNLRLSLRRITCSWKSSNTPK